MIFALWLSSAMALEVWSLPAMSSTGCEERVAEIAADVDGVVIKGNSYILREICVEGSFDTKQFQSDLKSAGFILAKKKKIKRCPRLPKMWSGVEGDFQLVSTGERFSMQKQRVEGKYTLFDFGAAWCPPCHSNAKMLVGILKQRNDLAIRAIDLQGKVEDGFYLPVAHQYLSKAVGLPWFIVFCKDGKKCYEGGSIQEILKLME